MSITNEVGASVASSTGSSSQIVDTALFTIVSTTTTSTITAGSSQTITVSSATGIVQYGWLTVFAGTINTDANQETVQVESISGTSVTAYFKNAHSGTTNVVVLAQRQIVTPGSASTQGNTAEYDSSGNAYSAIRQGTTTANVDSNNRLNTIMPDINVTGQTLSVSATTNANTIASTPGFGLMALEITSGTSGNFIIEGQIDGSNWKPCAYTQISSGALFQFGSNGVSNAIYYYLIGGYAAIRMRCSVTGSGSITYSYVLTNANLGLMANIAGINIAQINGNSAQTAVYGDSQSPGNGLMGVTAFLQAYNGSSSDRIRKDSYSAGPLWVNSGGGSTSAVASGAGTTVIKNTKGRLCRVLVTTLGTAALTFYDNASTTSGTIIGYIPASTTAGTIVLFDMPASNGITGDFLTSSPAATVSYW